MRSRRKQQGFTVLEVMASIGVMTVGAMAIVGLQVHTIRQNVDARNYTTAMQIAQTWSERLKLDAHTWTTQGTLGSSTEDVGQVLAQTRYLRAITTSNEPSHFYQLVPAVDIYHSNSFTYQGMDEKPATTPHFCVETRLGWVYYGHAMRADVRVYWPKRGAVIQDAVRAKYNLCNFEGSSDPIIPGVAGNHKRSFHVVHLPTVIRKTELHGA